jgi:hypothetical protein
VPAFHRPAAPAIVFLPSSPVKRSGLFATWIKDALINQASRCGFAYNNVYVGICTYIDENGTALSSHQEVYTPWKSWLALQPCGAPVATLSNRKFFSARPCHSTRRTGC